MSWVKAVQCSDDVFDENVDEFSLQNKEWSCNMEKRAKDGYRDGMDAGKEASLQVGFNLGYREGAVKTKAIGQLKGILSALQCWCQSQPSRISVLSPITELLRRVDQHEQDLVGAMRKAQEQQPPPSVSEVTGDLEDLGVDQSDNKGDSGCCEKNGDRDCFRKDGERDCGGQHEDTRSLFGVSSPSLFRTDESLEQLIQCCVELVAEMGLPEELTFHIQQLGYA